MSARGRQPSSRSFCFGDVQGLPQTPPIARYRQGCFCFNRKWLEDRSYIMNLMTVDGYHAKLTSRGKRISFAGILGLSGERTSMDQAG